MITRDRDLVIKFDTTPDATGLGRVIVNGEYYGLPADAVEALYEVCRKIPEANCFLNDQVPHRT